MEPHCVGCWAVPSFLHKWSVLSQVLQGGESLTVCSEKQYKWMPSCAGWGKKGSIRSDWVIKVINFPNWMESVKLFSTGSCTHLSFVGIRWSIDGAWPCCFPSEWIKIMPSCLHELSSAVLSHPLLLLPAWAGTDPGPGSKAREHGGAGAKI